MEYSRIYFDRKPPYQEESIMRMEHKKVNITYELQVELKNNSQTVTKSNTDLKMDNNTTKQNNKQKDNNIPLDKILESVSKLNEIYPNFNNMSDSEKMNIIANIINGKHDDIIWSQTNDNTTDSKSTDLPKTNQTGYTKTAEPTNYQEQSRSVDFTA